MPYWMFNHSKHVDLRAYALHVDLGVDAPHFDFKSHCSTRWNESLCSNTLIGTTCILHSQVVVVSCIVASSSSCCSWFKCQVEIIEQYVKYHYCLVKVVYVVKFHRWITCLLLLNVKSHPFCLNVASTWVTWRYPGLAADVSWLSRASS